MTMNPEAKAAWLDWLSKNPDKQTKGCLRQGDCFCILGSLCEAYREYEGEGSWDYDDNGYWRFKTPGMAGKGNRTELPKTVSDWAGFKVSPSLCTKDGRIQSLMVLNDSERLTFRDFRQAIDEQF